MPHILGSLRFALVEEVPHTLQVAAVVVEADAEVDVEELSSTRAQLARRTMADGLVRPGVHCRAVVAAPGVAEPAPRDLAVHHVRDLQFAAVDRELSA